LTKSLHFELTEANLTTEKNTGNVRKAYLATKELRRESMFKSIGELSNLSLQINPIIVISNQTLDYSSLISK